MGLIGNIKNFLMKGGAALVNSNGTALSQITDDRRISMDPEEYLRISRAFKYYSNTYPKRHYLDGKGKKREREFNSLNMTKRASARIASIVFNEQCEVNFENEELGKQVNEVLKENNFNTLFEEYLEKGVATGGFAIRPYVANDKIKLAWTRADQFYPLQSNTNEIEEAAIASRTTRTENDTTIYYTLLEFHQWEHTSIGRHYKITNELYRSSEPAIVGNKWDLHSIYPGVAEEVIMDGEGMAKPLFSYFKMPGANNINIESPLGLGVVDNSRHTLDNINLTHDSFMWEIRNGKRRIAVPASMLKFDDKHRLTFDTDDDVYQKMNSEDEFAITDLTKDIRVQQFTDSMNAWIREFEANIGMSAGTFSWDATSGVQTATGVVSQNSTTYQTRSSILSRVSATIEQLVQAIIEIGSTPEFFTDGKTPFSATGLDLNDLGISIHYDDGVFVDKDRQMDEDLKNVQANVLSKETFLVRNYGMSESAAQKELAKITDEQPEPEPSPEQAMFGGDNGDKPE